MLEYLGLTGGGLPPPHPPLPWAPSPPNLRPDRLKRTLYVYWGLTLVRMDQILPRQGSSELWLPFEPLLNLSELGPTFGRA